MKTARPPKVLARLVGEFFVIVLGVLMALWVTNWNEERKEDVREGEYLEGILTDLKTDSATLANREKIAVRGIEAADRLLALRADRSSETPADSLVLWLFHAAFVDNFRVQDHTYREILSSGGLALIQSRDLRRQVSEYYRRLESAEFFTDFYKAEEISYYNLLEERLPTDAYRAITVAQEQEQLPSFDTARAVRILRDDDQLANAVLSNRHWTVHRLGVVRRRLELNSELASAVATRLDRR
jgi:hypothetical protein